MQSNNKPTLWLSFDIESDGPVPLLNNMLSIGICGLDNEENIHFEYEANFLPLPGHTPNPDTMQHFWFDPKTPANKIAYEHTQINQKHYKIIMLELANHITELKKSFSVKFVAWPSAFDWQWLINYYELANSELKLEGKNGLPFIGYKAECASSVANMYCKMMHLENADKVFQELGGYDDSHNHFAIADAKWQGLAFVKMLKKLSTMEYKKDC